MSDQPIQPVPVPADLSALRAELRRAQQRLLEAEAELAEEQAAVNAFRMHCRLKLDSLVDALLELRARKQAALTRLALLRQDIEAAAEAEEADILGEAGAVPPEKGTEPMLLPTPTPRDKAAEKALYRELARRFHPDYATSAFERSYRTTIMTAVNTAYAAGNSDALYDLAGELSPEQAAGLGQIEDREARALREAISKIQRLRGKARRQLALLREENTARLWQRATALEDQTEDWWSLVRKELEQAIDRQAEQVADLEGRLAELVAEAALETEESS